MRIHTNDTNREIENMKHKIFKNRFFYIIFAIGLLCFFVPQARAAQTKPPTTTSWYVYVTSDESDQALYNWMYSAGYQAGRTDLSLPGTKGLSDRDRKSTRLNSSHSSIS